MKVRTIDVVEAAGRTLCSPVYRQDGKKLFSKGHLMTGTDAPLLGKEGIRTVCVAELEQGEIGEDDAVLRVAREIGCGALEIRLAAGGRANLFSTEPCCVLVDSQLLTQINCSTGIAIATSRNFSYSWSGQRVATLKSVPFSIAAQELDALISTIDQTGPILQGRPIREPAIAVLYTDESTGGRARELFENSLRQRLAYIGATSNLVLCSIEEEHAVARCLAHLLRANPTVILIASTISPTGPNDDVGRAMTRIGCHIERFLAPVDPGSLLLLGYKGDTPFVSAPGCFRSLKPNIVDLVLVPLLARYRIAGWEIGALGHGGLLCER